MLYHSNNISGEKVVTRRALTEFANGVIMRPSEEANICLKCDKKKCSGECARFKEEKKKLKGKVIKNGTEGKRSNLS